MQIEIKTDDIIIILTIMCILFAYDVNADLTSALHINLSGCEAMMPSIKH